VGRKRLAQVAAGESQPFFHQNVFQPENLQIQVIVRWNLLREGILSRVMHDVLVILLLGSGRPANTFPQPTAINPVQIFPIRYAFHRLQLSS
jgi:hypothetical protein